MALLGLFCSFKHTVNYLPGVDIDRTNLIELCRIKNKKYIELCDENVNIENITHILRSNVIDVLWFSGHGIYSDQLNWFMTIDENNNISDIRMINIILQNINYRSLMLVVVDICHSGSFFNLPYKYVADNDIFENTVFVNDWDKSTNKFNIIAIAACDDDRKEIDSSIGGGLLTENILKYINNQKSSSNLENLCDFLDKSVPNVVVTSNSNNIDFSNVYIC